MTKKEKQAIEDLKNIVIDLEDTEDGAIISLQQDEIDSLKILAELIEQQQKKIEEISKEELDTIINSINKHYISKDRIREKIYELEKEIEEKQEHGLDFTLIHEHEIDTNAIIRVLKQLLEE